MSSKWNSVSCMLQRKERFISKDGYCYCPLPRNPQRRNNMMVLVLPGGSKAYTLISHSCLPR